MKHLIKNKLAIALLLILPPVVTSFFISLFSASSGLASGAEHGAHEGAIPNMVWLQLINFGLYAGLLFYLFKKQVLVFFAAREATYHEAIKKADAVKIEAETKRREVQERLTKLESTRDQAIQQARAEALALRTQILEDAKGLAVKLKHDAEQTAAVELERGKIALRRELLDQSVGLATKLLSDKDKLKDQDQQRLQTEFVEKIQVVTQ